LNLVEGLGVSSATADILIYFSVIHDLMEIRTFHYTNEPRIDMDFSQALGYLTLELREKKTEELKRGAEGELNFGSLLEMIGLRGGIKADIENKKTNEHELIQQLSPANKLEIVERYLKREDEKLLPKGQDKKHLSELSLDDSSSINEQNLVEKLTTSDFYLLSGEFTITQETEEDNKFVVYEKAIGSQIIKIRALYQFFKAPQMLYIIDRTKISAFCSYLGHKYDLPKPGPIVTHTTTHLLFPRAIWQ
jgi:hypothetical protein